MPSLNQILTFNSSLPSLQSPKKPFVALFSGATSGIGLATLRVLLRSIPASWSPQFIILGRTKPDLNALQSLNPSAMLTFIQVDLSLLSSISTSITPGALKIPHLDLLYMSQGHLSHSGPNLTPNENLDLLFVLSYFSRIYLLTLLVPLLLKSDRPRVLSVLAGGHEKPLFRTTTTTTTTKGNDDDNGDLFLRNHKQNYTGLRAADQVTTIHSLAFIHLARDLYPKICFLHSHPSWVATGFFNKFVDTLKPAFVKWMGKNVVGPLFYNVFAMTEEEAGERQAYLCLNRTRYQSRETLKFAIVPGDSTERQEEAEKCHDGTSCSGFYRVLEDGRTVSDSSVLGPLEAEGWPERVWNSTRELLDEVLGNRD